MDEVKIVPVPAPVVSIPVNVEVVPVSPTASEAGKLNATDAKSLMFTSLKMGMAYALTYFAQNISGVDLGENAPALVIIITLVIDTVVKFLAGPVKVK